MIEGYGIHHYTLSIMIRCVIQMVANQDLEETPTIASLQETPVVELEGKKILKRSSMHIHNRLSTRYAVSEGYKEKS